MRDLSGLLRGTHHPALLPSLGRRSYKLNDVRDPMERRQQDPVDRHPAEPSITVALAIDEIDSRDAESVEILLADFLCAAWPSPAAQDQ